MTSSVSSNHRDQITSKRGFRPILVAYVAMLIVAAMAFAILRKVGESLPSPTTTLETVSYSSGRVEVNVTRHVLATMAAVIGLGYLMGRVLRYLNQPSVIGEVIAGILLGPSFLGAIYPEGMKWLIPGRDIDPHGQVVSGLQAIANLGIVLYMFLVGLELNAAQLKNKAHATVAISHASIVVPFILGAGISLWLYPILSNNGVNFTSFALFMGAALSVTAFPVLARILAYRNLERSEIGVLALGCAAADDVTAWCLLAFVVGVANTQIETGLFVALGAIVFIMAMFLLVQPFARRICANLDRVDRPLPSAAIPLVLVSLLISALITELIGIHAVFGAFLLGVVIPHDSRISLEVLAKIKDLVTVLLLPAFFALTGLRTEIALLHGSGLWGICLAIIVVATIGKCGGTFAAAQIVGHGWRTSAALGMMMNTRGLMGLIVLDVGLGLGIITSTLYAMMVVMALTTTAATSPVLTWLLPRSGEKEE